jgi:flagellar hook assembly protein FlgD
VTIEIYNTLGQKVRTLLRESKSAGKYSVVWDGTDDIGSILSTGAYFYRIQAGDFEESKKMMLLK